MFKTYEEISPNTVQAAQSPKPFLLEGQQFQAGDYILQDPNSGAISGVAAADFESRYREQKKTWSRKKKATEGETAGEGEQGSGEAANTEAVSKTDVAESVAAD